MRVLHVVNELSGGGAEQSTRLIVEGLSALGVPTAVFPCRSGNEVSWAGQVYRGKKSHGSGVLGVPSLFSRYIRAIQNFEPDVIHAHCELPEFLVAGYRGGAAVVVTEHSLQPWVSRRLVGSMVRRRLAAFDAKFVVPMGKSAWLSFIHPSRHVSWTDHAFHIPNPVRAPQLSPGNKRRIINVGRHIPSKRVDLVLETGALARLPIILLGDGPQTASLQSAARDQSLDVQFLGFRHDPWQYANSGDIFVSLSSSESSHLAAQEALLAGLTCVLSDIPAHRALRPFGAILANNPVEASIAIESAIEQAALNSRVELARLTSPAVVALSLLRVYQTALS